MTTKSRLSGSSAAIVVLFACALPFAAQAQTLGYGNVSGSGGGSGGGSGVGMGSGGGDAAEADAPEASSDRGRGGRGTRGVKRTTIVPYIEAAQIVTKELSPGDDLLTYSRLAAGVDGTIVGRNTAGSLSLRYERSFGWGRKAGDNDNVSGVARGYTTLLPGVRIDAGALATRTRIEQNGALVLGPQTGGDNVTQIYSAYVGPSVSTHVGDVALTGNYRIGYTRVEDSDSFSSTAQPAVDIFDDSVVQLADVHAGVKPDDVLPVGLGVGATYYREDISNLDQKVQDFKARADATLPIDNTLALVAGVGYEDVEVSSRDALRGSNGQPIIGRDGRYVTDKSAPRQIAYETDGLIWDAGVIWRPSRRTALEAHIGRRYGSTTYYGTFAYAPSVRSAFNVSVYDNVAGFGGQLNRTLIGLPTEFQAIRDVLNGNVGGCVSSVEGGNCIGSGLGSVRSAVFRARGVMATYSLNLGQLQTGFGAGYDRRRFIAAPGTVLGTANGTIDENYWLSAYLNGRLSEKSSFTTDIYANWFKPGASQVPLGINGDTMGLGASAAYNRSLTRHLSASAALGIDGVSRDDSLIDEDFWTASAAVGVRYSF
jgi:hypothetical protein